MSATEHDSVAAALAAVMGELGGIEKLTAAERKRRGIGGGDQGVAYAYRGIDQIAAQVQPLLAKHGVVMVPEVVSFDVRDITVNGKPWTDTTVLVRWTLAGRDGDPLVAQTLGLGRDNSDKGANKAMTQAFKNLLLRVLCIGDPDDDVDGHTHEADAAQPVADAPAVATHRRLAQVVKGSPMAEEIKRLAAQHGKALTVEGLSDAAWRAVVEGVLDNSGLSAAPVLEGDTP